MATSRVTSKGQVTIPAEVRKALGIEQGDDLVFELEAGGTAHLRVIKRQWASDLYGALRTTRLPGRTRSGSRSGQALASRPTSYA